MRAMCENLTNEETCKEKTVIGRNENEYLEKSKGGSEGKYLNMRAHS